MERFFEANRAHWAEVTPIHVQSAFYDVPAVKAGKGSLQRIEVDELGVVKGKTLLHLMCHFGLDTLSWARAGAVVTGVDFSTEALAVARGLAEELGIPARFIEANVYELPSRPRRAVRRRLYLLRHSVLASRPRLVGEGHRPVPEARRDLLHRRDAPDFRSA